MHLVCTLLTLSENTLKNRENTVKFMTFGTFSLCPLWICPLRPSNLVTMSHALWRTKRVSSIVVFCRSLSQNVWRIVTCTYREEHPMDQYRSRLKLSENFERAIGPYLFLGKFVWTNGPESSSKVPPPHWHWFMDGSSQRPNHPFTKPPFYLPVSFGLWPFSLPFCLEFLFFCFFLLLAPGLSRIDFGRVQWTALRHSWRAFSDCPLFPFPLAFAVHNVCCVHLLQQFDSVNIWCIAFFPVLKPLAGGRQSRCLG